ncbi:fibrinogen C domain-containing protein 1 [Perca flavescens]|uniref:fibrinogen C domain-containing protein 1 n=1 Tax=Perca flavescens TaxID=8167 RepID=UPI00106EB1B1|nr:fibrinogen C domain-containing protein 1-like [Perca flavescens]
MLMSRSADVLHSVEIPSIKDQTFNHCSFHDPCSNRGGVSPSSSSTPVISTNPRDSGALVSVSRVTDGEPISIFLDPNCPDYSESFLRWEALQSSLLHKLTNHNSDNWQDTGLAPRLAEELKALAGHAHHLRLEADSLKRGQAVLEQRLDELQSEQRHIMQSVCLLTAVSLSADCRCYLCYLSPCVTCLPVLAVSLCYLSPCVLSGGQSGVSKLSAGFTDSVLGLQRETESLRRLTIELKKDSNNRAVQRPRDCSDVMASGVSEEGVYSVFPKHDPDGFMVYCDMSTDGGGWTVIQRREDGSVNFFRDWKAYRDGFGKTTGEHWLGLQRIYSLTRSGGYELRIDMADFDNATAFALYGDFSVGRDSVNPEEDGYPLAVDQYSGTAGDSLLKHSGMQFTTKDRDQDQSENNCAAYYQGAWWYRNCHTSNLNGQYLKGGHASYADGVEWSSWTGWQYSLRFTEMKIRPKQGS